MTGIRRGLVLVWSVLVVGVAGCVAALGPARERPDTCYAIDQVAVEAL